MAQVRRFDALPLRSPKRLRGGILRADAHTTRSGVFVYRNQDGTERREYRPPEEVFHADALESLAGPLTNEHPRAGLAGPADVVGVADDFRRDGDWVAGTIRITDPKTVADVEAGKRQLSHGYRVDLDETPGVTPQGEKYDAVQRNIRGDHLAIVSRARAGEGAAIRMDAGDAMQVEPHAHMTAILSAAEVSAPRFNNSQERQDMADKTVKSRIDGVEYDVSEQAAQAVAKEQAAHASLKSDLDKQTARADDAEEKVKAAEKARADAEDPAKVAALVAARVQLEVEARKHLGAEIKLDALTDRAVRAAVVEKLTGKPMAAEKSDVYVQARFDAAVEAAPSASLNAIRPGAESSRTDSDDGDADKARAEMVKRNQSAWTPQKKGA